MLEAQVKIGVGSSQSSVLEDAVREAMGSALRTLEEHAPHWLFITATDNYDSEGGLHAIVAMCKDLIHEFCASGAGTDAEETETQFHATTTCRAVLNDTQGFVSASPAGDREATQGCALGIFCIWNPRHVLEAARPHVAAGNFAVASCDQDAATAKESNKHFYGNVKKTCLTDLKRKLVRQATIESRRDNAKRLLSYGQADVGLFVDIWDHHAKKRGRIVKFEKTGKVKGTHSVMFGKQLRDMEARQMEDARFVMVPPHLLSAADTTRLVAVGYGGDQEEKAEHEEDDKNKKKPTNDLVDSKPEKESGVEEAQSSDDDEVFKFLSEMGLSEFYMPIRAHGVRSLAELFDPDVIDEALLSSPAIGMAPNQREHIFNAMESELLEDCVLWLSTTPGLEQPVLDLIATIFPPSVKVVGGTAADNDLAGTWSVCGTDDTAAVRNGFVVSGLQLNLEMRPIFLNTCIPVPTSEGAIISRGAPAGGVPASGTAIELIRDGSTEGVSSRKRTALETDNRTDPEERGEEDAARVYRRWVRNFTGSSDRLPEVSSMQSQSNARTTLQQTASYPLGLRIAKSGDPNMDFVNTWPTAMYRLMTSDGASPTNRKKAVEVVDLNVQWAKIRSLLGTVTLMQATEASLTNLGDGIWKNLNRNERQTPQPMGALAVYSGGALQNMMRSFRGSVVDDLANSIGASLSGSPFLMQFSYGEQGFHSGCLKTMHSNLMASALVFLQRPRAHCGGDLDEALERAAYYVQSDQGRSMCAVLGFDPDDMHMATEALHLLGYSYAPALEVRHVEAFVRCFGVDIFEDVLLGSKYVLGRSLEVASHLRELARREPHKAKWFDTQAERLGGLSLRLLDILCEVYGDADAMWLLCADRHVVNLRVDDRCKEHMDFLSSRIVQELLDECFLVGDVFYSDGIVAQSSSSSSSSSSPPPGGGGDGLLATQLSNALAKSGGSKHKCGCLTPRGNFLLRLAAHIVATALLAYGTLEADASATAADARLNASSQNIIAFVLGTLIATVATVEDIAATFSGYGKVAWLPGVVSVPQFRYNGTFVALQSVAAVWMIFASIVGQAPIATSLVLLVQVFVVSKFTALDRTMGPLQTKFASLLGEIFAVLVLLLVLAAACSLALVAVNIPEKDAPYEYRAVLPCYKALVGSMLLGAAGVFETGSDHRESALLVLPEREDYEDGYRHALTQVYVYGFYGAASMIILNMLLGLFTRSDDQTQGGGGSSSGIATHKRAFLVRRWFYATDYKSRLFAKVPPGGTSDLSRSPSPMINAAAGHMADGSNRTVSIAVAVRQLRRETRSDFNDQQHQHHSAPASQQPLPS